MIVSQNLFDQMQRQIFLYDAAFYNQSFLQVSPETFNFVEGIDKL